jgi:hypothetical protein
VNPKPEDLPPLPPQAAFVVQFQADADIELKMIAGRVEHVVSGQSTYFISLDELLAFMNQTLNTVRAQSSGED